MNQLALSYGVVPVQIKHCEDINTLIDEALNTCKQKELIHNGDLLIITAGILAGVTGGTNVLRVYLVANEIARGIGYGDTVVKGYIRKKTVSGELSPNCIVITDEIEQLKKEQLPLAVITSQSAIASPIIHFCREHGIPVIGGIAIDELPCSDGDDVTLDILRGTIYRGNVHLPF